MPDQAALAVATFEPKIRLDDWIQSVDKLVPAAKAALQRRMQRRVGSAKAPIPAQLIRKDLLL